jgi:AraC-like DNA-binding protein
MEPLLELRDSILRHAGGVPRATPQSDRLGLKFIVERSTSGEPIHLVHEPLFGVVVQGEKQLAIGDKLFTCTPGNSLVVSVDLPVALRISTASPNQPYLAIAMALKPAQVATLLLEAGGADDADDLPVEAAGLGVGVASRELLEAIVRLVRLLDHPRDLPVLGPLAEREIMWRLLCSEQGHRLRQVGLADSHLSQLGRAMRWMRDNYGEQVRIEELARLSGMSVTSFHRQFRAVAFMSPLQYLKQIRLREARAQLLAGAEDVARVGQVVGYDSASQFSREYKRAFGFPPGQDARLLRASAAPRRKPFRTARAR